MNCSACAHPLPTDARFCPSCGTPNRPSAVSAATAVRSGRAEERKVVTIVFCDLVGSTRLSAALDPETLRSVTLRYFEVMRHQIESCGGTLEKFIGDAVMAVFGVPSMREDDARRALAATLGMLEALARLNAELEPALGVRLDVRIGVNTGQVVAGSDNSTRQALISGETVNVAARLEQNAGAGQILIGPETLRAAGPAARVAPVGPLHLKGKAEPVSAHRLLGLGDDDPGLLRRFDLPFVGRGRELARLDAVLDRAAGGGGAQLAVVGGEAGLGKTRLVREWLGRRDRSGPRGALCGAGRCRTYGDRGSLTPLAEALRQVLDEHALRHPDAPALTGTGNGTSTVADPGSEAVADALAVLDAGLLLDGTPNPSVNDTCAALVRLLSVLAARAPVVLVVDDAHWATPVLLDVVERVVAELGAAAVLVVCLARPELFDTRPGWGAAGRALPLAGLSAEEAVRLAAGLTEVGAHSACVSERLLERAGGNPLHLEQLLAMDVSDLPAGAAGPTGTGGVGEGVPATLQALLGARIDALERAERVTLDLASVLGREFDADELVRLAASGPEDELGGGVGTGDGSEGPARAALARLSRRRLVEPARRTAPDRIAFRFSSGLVQEVAYACMSKRSRAERHERAAGLASVRADGHGAVAAHLERAHRYRTELGLLDAHTETLRRRAADGLARAGALALSRSDLSWADDLLDRAVRLSRPGEPAGVSATRRLGEARLALGRTDQGRRLLRQLLDHPAPGTPAPGTPAPGTPAPGTPAPDHLAPDHSAPATPAPDHPAPDHPAPDHPAPGTDLRRPVDRVEAAHARLALATLDPGGPAAVAETAQAVLPVFEAAGDDLGQARARIRLAQHYQVQGRHGRADQALTRALAHARRADAEPERAVALGAMGISLWRGPEPVPVAVERCRELLAEHGPGRRTVRATLGCPLAMLLALRDQPAEAHRLLAESASIAGELGYAEAEVFIPVFAAAVDALTGRRAQALSRLAQAAEAGGRLGGGGLLATVSLETARLLADDARWAEAAEALDRLTPAGQPSTLPGAEAVDEAGIRSRIAAAGGRSGEALRLARAAVEAAARTDSPIVQAVAALDRAHALRLLGRPEQAAAAAATAGARFAQKGHLPGVRWAAALSGAAAGPQPRTRS
ncbi:AAA family ATPase [Streptacidiphilus sp. PB12-B1b]|uniref:adenylate/guanylate cyclase domain-containing protein n=1 Tax=Streptacidiphilus sp. PB12-B1b TaxID=2705012 RepID=UPI0015FC8E7A|nr:adenylate/guanylate cyclase domain-containing protein [Streptacidiphilus sp. PB12-B1b]QMU78060.1 AAA family ATPase [Streptacidiphilus sp. PB12-B1b]